MVLITGRLALDHFEGFLVKLLEIFIYLYGFVCVFLDHIGLFHYHVEEGHHMQFIYLCYAFLLGNLSHWSNFWSFSFFLLIFLAELSAIVSLFFQKNLVILAKLIYFSTIFSDSSMAFCSNRII